MEPPTGLYRLQSGAKEGISVECLMFNNYPYLRRLYKRIVKEYRARAGSKPNALHRQLYWLLRRGEDRKPRMLCPMCGQRPVVYFSKMVTGYKEMVSVRSDFTCCDSPACQDAVARLSAGKNYELRPFKFSELLSVSTVIDSQTIGKLFRDVFELPKPLTAEAAFAFFSEN